MDQTTATQPTTSLTPQTIQPAHEERKLLLGWESPSRPYKKRDKDFYTTVTTIAILSAVILFFLNEFLVIIVIFAFVFFVFVLSSIPPENMTHQIFNTGIKTGEYFYAWSELIFFRFESRWGSQILYVRTKNTFPGALYILLGSTSKDQVEQVIGTSLVKRDDIDNTWMDRSADWLTKKIPLEKQP